MISLDKTLIIQIISFLTIMFILNKFLFKDMIRIVIGREEKIKNEELEIKTFIEKAEAIKNECEKRIMDARVEAIKDREKLIKEGIEKEEGIIRKANMEMENMVIEFNEKLEKEVEKAKEQLNLESNRISNEIAQKILGRNI